MAEKRAVFGSEFEVGEDRDNGTVPVTEAASWSQARPISTRRMIICGEMHCSKYETERNRGAQHPMMRDGDERHIQSS